MQGAVPTISTPSMYEETWTYEVECNGVKLPEMFQRAKRIMKIQTSKETRKISLKKVEGVIQDEGQILEMDKFAELGGRYL